MTTTRFRAVAVLTPKTGKEQALIDFTLAALPTIRAVEGLADVEVCRGLEPSLQLFLYYWWSSPQASADYMSGPVYARLGPDLAALVDDHVLLVGELLSAGAAN